MKNLGKSFHFYSSLLFLILILFVLVSIILNPTLSMKSVNEGIMIWFNILLPSLLPFFIISEILIGSGFIDLLGKLLNPLMFPIFRVPGKGAFPLVMALLSGYPVGSRLTSRLREEKLISKHQADRLICFTSSSGPLFILGAVSIGLLGSPSLGSLILLPHYLSVFSLGLIFRNYKYDLKEDHLIESKEYKFRQLLVDFNSWANTKKSIASLISKSIKESMDNILIIGGLVIFYSILIEILFNNRSVNDIFIFLSNISSINLDLIKGLVIGFFEITMGCKTLALADISNLYKLMGLNFVIGWAGLSVHSQALSSISKTDISTKLYFLAKLLQGLLSSFYSYIFYIFKYKNQPTNVFNLKTYSYSHFNLTHWLSLLKASTKTYFLVLVYLTILATFSILAQRIRPRNPS